MKTRIMGLGDDFRISSKQVRLLGSLLSQMGFDNMEAIALCLMTAAEIHKMSITDCDEVEVKAAFKDLAEQAAGMARGEFQFKTEGDT